MLSKITPENKEILFSTVIEREAALIGALYSSKPYSCAIPEAAGSYNRYLVKEKDLTITHVSPTLTTIEIAPVKGTGRRKPFIVNLWK